MRRVYPVYLFILRENYLEHNSSVAKAVEKDGPLEKVTGGLNAKKENKINARENCAQRVTRKK